MSLSPSPVPFNAKLYDLLWTQFHLQHFRDGQEAAITAAIDGKDVFVRLPTGGGKTLTIILPALYNVDEGITVIIVPLISLVQQHVATIILDGLHVLPLHWGMSHRTRKFVREAISLPIGAYAKGTGTPLPTFLVCTPEKLLGGEDDMKEIFRDLHKRGLIGRFVIDEAQCALNWARFRPAYKEIGRLREEFPDVPITVISASMTDDQMDTLEHNLKLKDPVRVLRPLDRPNLRYEIRHFCTDKDALDALVSFVYNEVGTESTIIYCPKKSDCVDVVEKLRARGVMSFETYYGSGNLDDDIVGSGETSSKKVQNMTPEQRSERASRWRAGEVQIMVATTSFSVGIHKDDVRFVLHYGPAESVTEWFQQSGRAGRDNKPARCITFYRRGSLMTHVRLIVDDWLRESKANTQPTSGKFIEFPSSLTEPIYEIHLMCIEALASAQCLRNALLLPYREMVACGDCSGCENRPPSPKLHDMTTYAVKALDALAECYRLDALVSETLLAGFLYGSSGDNLKKRGLDNASLYRTGRTFVGSDGSRTELKLDQIRAILHVLLIRGVFKLVAMRVKTHDFTLLYWKVAFITPPIFSWYCNNSNGRRRDPSRKP
ncbi:ATP-dependent DNA helicase [Exidia glandulosa HHB12029]|uniref:DNA 3'-5' helicase n=1 Tax=Exidia glandulosa HHB12029 TaxID=1314781 RepID=A0A165P195_EXIGL|nr:ATP-dependent DNA helicase [Exidia glandulosa HHB12029]